MLVDDLIAAANPLREADESTIAEAPPSLSRYLAALRRADGSDSGPLGEFLARAILDNLYKFVVPAIAGPARLVPLPALETPELSADAPAGGGGAWQAEGGKGRRWDLAQLDALGGGVRGEPLQARRMGRWGYRRSPFLTTTVLPSLSW